MLDQTVYIVRPNCLLEETKISNGGDEFVLGFEESRNKKKKNNYRSTSQFAINSSPRVIANCEFLRIAKQSYFKLLTLDFRC